MFTMIMNLEINRAIKRAKTIILTELCNQIDIAKQYNNSKTPYEFISKQVIATKAICPWISSDSIMNDCRRRKSVTSFICVEEAVITTDLTVSVAPVDLIFPVLGRPKGSTNKRKAFLNASLVATRNEIIISLDRAILHRFYQSNQLL